MREVFITDTAKADIESIASFLQENHSNKVKVDFLVKLSEKLIFIETTAAKGVVAITTTTYRTMFVVIEKLVGHRVKE